MLFSLIEVKPFIERRMGIRLADQNEIESQLQQQFAERLLAVEIISQYRCLVQLYLFRISSNPPFRSSLLTVLLVMPILRDDEFWLQGDNPIAVRRNQDWNDHIVKIELVSFCRASVGAVLTGDFL